jgi:hypothetical protein
LKIGFALTSEFDQPWRREKILMAMKMLLGDGLDAGIGGGLVCYWSLPTTVRRLPSSASMGMAEGLMLD